MTGTTAITAVTLIVASSAALGVAHYQGWGAFGDIEQVMAPAETCMPPVSSTGWSNGAGSSSIAETRALISWSKRANKYGSSYASWHNARARDLRCMRLSESSTKCIIKGRPCERKADMDFDRLF